MVTEEFKKIAVSFAGGDGGNPKSEVWFCGLEWGIGDESSPDDFYEKFSLSPKLIPHSWVEDDFDGSWTTQYNRKIMATILIKDYLFALTGSFANGCSPSNVVKLCRLNRY